MSDSYEQHPTEDARGHDSASKATSYQRSTIAFPYSPLRDAENIVQELHDKWGGRATLDQLAGGMGTGPRGGTFRTKVATSRTFGATEIKDGTISVTNLGYKLLDPQTRAAARVDAFLRVPLFALLTEHYKGTVLPPDQGLEKRIAEFGVSPKQVRRARAAFQSSAKLAGFFNHAKDRLVQPKLDEKVGGNQPLKLEAGNSSAAGGADGSQATLPAPVAELWLTLLQDGRAWSPEKTHEFVAAARKLHDLLSKSGESPAHD